jgi:thiamine biosynthesis lipoprotein
MQQISFRAMNCNMMAAVDRAGPRVAQRLRQVPNWFVLWEQRLSRFRPDSELSRINLSASQPVAISSVMQEVLHSALRAARISGGMVTPTVLGALEAAGYNRSFDELYEAVPAEVGSLDSWVAHATAIPIVELNAHARTVRLASGTRLDLGGIAKGWAADRAAHHLRRLGPVLVNAGGDIAVTAPMEDGEPWPIGVIDPFDPEKDSDILLVYQGGVATSGRDYRRWMKDKLWQHHIIDPRSGQPAQTDVLTATVVAPSAQAAEIAAKVVFIAGSSRGIEWLNHRPEYAGLVVLEDGEKIHSHRWMDYVRR